MGGGSWTAESFVSYSTSIGRTVDHSTGAVSGSYTSQEIYQQPKLHEVLNPRNVMRECVDSDEHPNTIPVILALDVTGSMGSTAVEVAKNINVVMTKLYEDVKDIEFMIMGIGDLAFDDAPIQISQFESDIRIAEQLDKVYFEYGGGSNPYESYTAAWYMGLYHTKLDCWNRGRKGIIITLGDEQINPYLPQQELQNITGDTLQTDVETKQLYKDTSEKFDIYHIDVEHGKYWSDRNSSSWRKYLDDEHFKTVSLNEVTDTIISMIMGSIGDCTENLFDGFAITTNENGEIVW